MRVVGDVLRDEKAEGYGTELSVLNRNGIVGAVSTCVSVYSYLKRILQNRHSLYV